MARRKDTYPTDPKYFRTVGDHVRARRKALGLRQRDVADLVGVAKPTVGGWEARGLPPGAETMPSVVEFLGYAPKETASPAELVTELVALRKRLRLPRSAMAERLGVSYATLWAWERGVRRPRGPYLARVLWAIQAHQAGSQ